MPFLCILQKPADTGTPDAAGVNRTRLAELLCPYDGEPECAAVGRAELFLSSLAAVRPETGNGVGTVWSIPRGIGRAPQTAWLEISASHGAMRFETDPLGTFPLWYFEDERSVVVTGEVKALLAIAGARVEFHPEETPDNAKRPPDWSPYRNVRRVPPGAALVVTEAREIVIQRRTPLTFTGSSMFASPEESAAALNAELLRSADSISSGADGWATLLSGGIDSSMATALMQSRRPNLSTFTLGTEYGNEYTDAADLASYLGTPHSRVFAAKDDALRHFERAVFCNETVDGLTAETLAQLSVLVATASKKVRHVVTGYGADLLFGSMLRHELYMMVTGVDSLQSLIERTCWSQEFAPFYAWSLGVDVHHLFWSPSLMNCAFRIPAEQSFDGTQEKLVLRGLAVANGHMLERHAFRKKQAMTDGTQFNRVLSEALGLTSPHAYDKKNAASVAVLRKLYRT